jgi:hypothetical protein
MHQDEQDPLDDRSHAGRISPEQRNGSRSPKLDDDDDDDDDVVVDDDDDDL